MRTHMCMQRKAKDKKESPVLSTLASEINETVSTNSVSYKKGKKVKKLRKNIKGISKFNEKEKFSSFVNKSKKSNLSNISNAFTSPETSKNTSDFKTQEPVRAIGDYKSWCDRLRRINFETMSPNTLKKHPKSGIIHTKKKMEFINEITHHIHKIKLFKEDDVPFTKSCILPPLIIQEVENDVLTDEEQVKDGVKKELKWVNETLQKISEDRSYLRRNLELIKLCKHKRTRKTS